MPFFVTVSPGTVVTNDQQIDASILNLLGQPSVSVTGSIDGASLVLGVGTVDSSSIVAGAIKDTHLDPNAVTNTKVNANAISTDKIVDANVTLAKLAPNSVNDSKVLVDSIGVTKLAPLAVNTVVGRGTGGTANAGLLLNGGLGSNATDMFWKPYIVQTHSIIQSLEAVSQNRTSPYLIPNFTTGITTVRINSRILVTINLTYEVDEDAVFILKRFSPVGGTVEIGSGTSLAGGLFGIAVAAYDTNNDGSPSHLSIDFLDTVATAQLYTYSLYVHAFNAGNIAINRTMGTGGGPYEGASSRMILQEYPV